MTAPTPGQLELLRLLAAGVELHAPLPGKTLFRLLLNGHPAGTIQQRTVTQLWASGFISPEGERYRITAAGRAQAETGTFVRAFIASVAEGA